MAALKMRMGIEVMYGGRRSAVWASDGHCCDQEGVAPIPTTTHTFPSILSQFSLFHLMLVLELQLSTLTDIHSNSAVTID